MTEVDGENRGLFVRPTHSTTPEQIVAHVDMDCFYQPTVVDCYLQSLYGVALTPTVFDN
jgi:hypothetical protein